MPYRSEPCSQEVYVHTERRLCDSSVPPKRQLSCLEEQTARPWHSPTRRLLEETANSSPKRKWDESAVA